MNFRDEGDAAEFAEAYNGKQFNSMEVCLYNFLTLIPFSLTPPF